MEVILILGVLTSGAVWLGHEIFQAGRSSAAHSGRRIKAEATASERQQREQQNRQQEARDLQQQRQHRQRLRQQALNKKYRALQIALLQINQAPDFQRAASRAEAALSVPLDLRQRQYHRFRSQLVQHFVRRLRAGTDGQILLDSLTTLIEALGIASFEANYIQQEASRQEQQTNQRPTENFSTTLERMQQEHTDRTTALNQATLDPETKQQLLEAQNQRLIDSLMEMTLGAQGESL